MPARLWAWATWQLLLIITKREVVSSTVATKG